MTIKVSLNTIEFANVLAASINWSFARMPVQHWYGVLSAETVIEARYIFIKSTTMYVYHVNIDVTLASSKVKLNGTTVICAGKKESIKCKHQR